MGYPYYEDLTPGDFRNGVKPVEVKTDSLEAFGTGFAAQAETYFGTLSATQNALLTTVTEGDVGSRAIGNSETLSELVTVADYAKGAAEKSKKLSEDLMYGNLALAHAASWMAQKYGATDDFNAVRTSDAVNDAFHPPSDAPHTTAKERAAREEAERQAREAAERETAPPSGRDPADNTTDPGWQPPTSDGSTGDPTDTNPDGDGSVTGDNNPYYTPEQENDFDPGHYFSPPTADVSGGEMTELAPGADFGSGGNTGVTV